MHKPKKTSALNAPISLSGQITINAEIDDWSADQTISLLWLRDSGTKLAISHSVEVKGINNFQLDADTTVEIDGDYTVSSPETTRFGDNAQYANCFAQVNHGIIKATGKIATGVANIRFGPSSASADGVLVANQFNVNGRFVLNSYGASNGGTLVVGAGGMTSSTGDFYIQANSPSLTSTIRPSADFAVNATIGSANGSTKSYGVVIFNTTDYYDANVGRTITVNKAVNDAYVRAWGKGTLLFNVAGGPNLWLIANDTCTVAANPGCQPGNGAVTLNGASTLKVAKSGTVTLGGTLTLYAADTSLAFNFTERSTAPKLVIPTLAFNTGVSTVNVKISAEDGVRPKHGTYILASSSSGNFAGKTINTVEAPAWVKSVGADADGNLVCKVKPAGLIISIL